MVSAMATHCLLPATVDINSNTAQRCDIIERFIRLRETIFSPSVCVNTVTYHRFPWDAKNCSMMWLLHSVLNCPSNHCVQHHYWIHHQLAYLSLRINLRSDLEKPRQSWNYDIPTGTLLGSIHFHSLWTTKSSLANEFAHRSTVN